MRPGRWAWDRRWRSGLGLARVWRHSPAEPSEKPPSVTRIHPRPLGAESPLPPNDHLKGDPVIISYSGDITVQLSKSGGSSASHLVIPNLRSINKLNKCTVSGCCQAALQSQRVLGVGSKLQLLRCYADGWERVRNDWMWFEM